MGLFDNMGSQERTLGPDDYEIGDEFQYREWIYKVIRNGMTHLLIDIYDNKKELICDELIPYTRIETEKHLTFLLPENKINKKANEGVIKIIPKGFGGPIELDNLTINNYEYTDHPKEILNTKPPCIHSWKLYTGLAETFHYCEHCDLKKDK